MDARHESLECQVHSYGTIWPKADPLYTATLRLLDDLLLIECEVRPKRSRTLVVSFRFKRSKPKWRNGLLRWLSLTTDGPIHVTADEIHYLASDDENSPMIHICPGWPADFEVRILGPREQLETIKNQLDGWFTEFATV